VHFRENNAYIWFMNKYALCRNNWQDEGDYLFITSCRTARLSKPDSLWTQQVCCRSVFTSVAVNWTTCTAQLSVWLQPCPRHKRTCSRATPPVVFTNRFWDFAFCRVYLKDLFKLYSWNKSCQRTLTAQSSLCTPWCNGSMCIPPVSAHQLHSQPCARHDVMAVHVYLLSLLTSALDGGERLTVSPNTYWTGDRVCSILDKRINSCPYRQSNHHPTHSVVTTLTELPSKIDLTLIDSNRQWKCLCLFWICWQDIAVLMLDMLPSSAVSRDWGK
jgi:hypothetical protein